jgi:hypothetical protein
MVIDMNKSLLILAWRPRRRLAVGSAGNFSAIVVLFAMAVLPIGVARGQNPTIAERETAKTWGMRDIAILQAEMGDFQGAKNTLSQIDENGPKRPARVTAVWPNNGRPVYRELSAEDAFPAIDQKSPGWGKRDANGTLYFLACDRAPDSVPTSVPAGLPANYLDADPNHGMVVDFTDECDSHGTRVTARRYADGYAIIETPKSVAR